MVKHTARDYRSMARKIRQLEQALTKSNQKVAETQEEAELFKKNAFAKKAEYDKQLKLQCETNDILRKSLKNFSGPLYATKRENTKLAKENKTLLMSLKRAKTNNDSLYRGLKQIQALRRAKKQKKKRPTKYITI